MLIDRRRFGLAALSLAAAPAWPKAPAALDLTAAIKAAETLSGGRVGLCVNDLATGRNFAWRGDERFPMASTFKLPLVAAVLQRIEAGQDRLDRAIPVKAQDILGNSPISARHVGGTATVAQLAEGTITHSDNTAANLLLPSIGGPAGLTAFLRRTGDPVTRLDRIEPAMSEATPGDPRDTTSPIAIAATWQRLLTGNVLAPASRQRLITWLVANTTGGTRLRAGLPKTWRIGDKTGTGDHGTVNDIAITWPARQAPASLIIACFITGGTAPDKTLHRVHADLARAIAAAIA